MQCHAIVLDATGTTHALQQPRYIEREQTRKTKKEKERKDKLKKEKKRKNKGNKMPRELQRIARETVVFTEHPARIPSNF